jgi:threonine aldolase
LTPIDLRSDTVTVPTQRMRDAMSAAAVGDDGRLTADGHSGDPTVVELEERAAALFAKPAALFMPSGTMANLVALRTWCARGATVAVGATAHLYRREISAFQDDYFGLRAVELADDDGLPDAGDLSAGISLLCLENTHNAAGGTAWTPEAAAPLLAAGVPVHLDGARLLNAAVSLDRDPAELAAPADSLMFCLTKGLGAPMGAILLGEADFIGRARTVRKLLGGQMRQIGVAAAAGLVALNGFADWLRIDHTRARRLAQLLGDLRGARVDPDRVQTNIVQVLLPASGPPVPDVVRDLTAAGVLVHSTGDAMVRLVTHRDLSDADITRAASVLRAVLDRR